MQHFERARTIYAGVHHAPTIANIELEIADALWRDDGDAARARMLVESAARVYADTESWDRLAEAQRWLATHDQRR
jgi:hypothetical protein